MGNGIDGDHVEHKAFKGETQSVKMRKEEGASAIEREEERERDSMSEEKRGG